MNCLPTKSGRFLFLSVAASMLLAGRVAAQERPTVVPFEGFEAFGHILFAHKLQPLPQIESLAQVAPEETLIIVLGDPRMLDAIRVQVGGWEKFQASGGAILIACDYLEQKRLEHWKISIPGTKVRQAARLSYQENWEECPLVKEKQLSAKHPLFKDVRKGLATNRPSYLVGRETDLHLLAELGPECHRVPGIFDLPEPRPDDPPLIYGSNGQAPPGERMLVIANQGVFMNGMMIQDDNDNLQFAWNAIGWLREGPRGNRTHALLVEEGRVVSKFGLPLARPAPLPIPKVQVLNQMLRGLELENRFNQLLLDNIGREPILRVLLLSGTVLLLLMAARRIMLGRFRQDTAATLIVGGRPEVAEPAFVQREQELLLRGGNLWEPAQVLVRQFFLEQGVAPPLWDRPAALPQVEAAGNWWQRRSLAGHVHRLWRLTQTSPAERVAPRDFRRIVALLEELKVAASAGRLRILQARLSP